jgi:hypothetical protein
MSAVGTKQTWPDVRLESAFAGKAEVKLANIEPVNGPIDDTTKASDYRPHCRSSAKFAAGIQRCESG